MDSYLLIKYLKCATSPEEEVEVRSWLSDDPDGRHQVRYKSMHDIYNGMILYGPDDISVRHKQKKSFLHFVALGLSCAAVFIGMILFTGFFAKRNTMRKLSSEMEKISVPAGKSLHITLEDGTGIWLNAGTEIEYPVVFGRKSRRVVVKNGEVLFDVSKDKKRPFTVETFASDITVLGTRFDVEVDENRNEFSVALLRGCVKAVNKISSGEEYTMEPNDMLTLLNNHFSVSRIKNRTTVDCWTDGLINVTDVPFDVLMRKFELAFNIRIIIDRNKLPEISYTRGKIRISDGINHALDVLMLASDFTYVRDYEANTIVIK
jgi:ferric-dicitrate binding protein FerR (iron transport regulator)